MSDNEEEILFAARREVGKEAVPVVKLLLEAEDALTVEALEEQLTETETPLEKKRIRKILYQLNELGWARSRRIRDKETGWLHYRWYLFPDRIPK